MEQLGPAKTSGTQATLLRCGSASTPTATSLSSPCRTTVRLSCTRAAATPPRRLFLPPRHQRREQRSSRVQRTQGALARARGSYHVLPVHRVSRRHLPLALFATQEEADYYDKTTQGSETGESHPHVYVDDPTNTTWYMPEHNNNMGSTTDPTTVINLFEGQPVTYTEITSLSNADLTPPAFADTTSRLTSSLRSTTRRSPLT